MLQSSQSVAEDRQSWGSGRIIYTDYAALTIANRHERKTNPLCSGGVLVSVIVAPQAAAGCDSVVTTRACCHSLPFSVP